MHGIGMTTKTRLLGTTSHRALFVLEIPGSFEFPVHGLHRVVMVEPS